MIRINLLPHREAKRKARQIQFGATAAVVAVIALVVSLLVYQFNAGLIEAQKEKNDFLTKEIKTLEAQITDINQLKAQTEALLARKQVIENLQSNRAEAVRLLDQLTRQTPDEVFVKQMKQQGALVELTGYAQANSRVSSFMRNIEGSQFLGAPVLVEIKAVTVGGRALSEFQLRIMIKRPKAEDKDKKPGAKKT